jgi:phage terminase small subunit
VELTSKQRLFVAYYLGEAKGNATQAARMAGYSSPQKQGSQLLAKTRIRAAIESKLAKVAMSADEVLARLSEFAAADLSDFISVTDDGEGWVDLTRTKKRLRIVKKLKFTKRTFEREGLSTTDQTAEIELHSPLAALDKLAQYHRLYDEKPGAVNPHAVAPRIIIPGAPGNESRPKAEGSPRKRKPTA